MGVGCERPGGVGHLYYTAMGGVIQHRLAFLHTITHPLLLSSPSVNGHLCVKNSTLVPLYRECLLEFQR